MKASRLGITYLLTALCSLGVVAQRTGIQFPTCETNVTDRCSVSCVEGNNYTYVCYNVSLHDHTYMLS